MSLEDSAEDSAVLRSLVLLSTVLFGFFIAMVVLARTIA